MIMTRTRLIATSLILLGLAACQPETIDPNKDRQGQSSRGGQGGGGDAAMPMIASSKIYRCDDNSIANVDFMDDGVTANLKMGKRRCRSSSSLPRRARPSPPPTAIRSRAAATRSSSPRRA